LHSLRQVMMRVAAFAVLLAGAVLPFPTYGQDAVPAVPVSDQGEDAAAGEVAFARCSACHGIGENAAHRMGPQLNGVVGRRAGTQEGFGYSRAMIAAGASGLIWTPETLTPFLHKPRDFVPGTKMSFSGVPDAETIAEIVA
jgi:cytochrome c